MIAALGQDLFIYLFIYLSLTGNDTITHRVDSGMLNEIPGANADITVVLIFLSGLGYNGISNVFKVLGIERITFLASHNVRLY